MFIVSFIDQKYPDDAEICGPFTTEESAARFGLRTIQESNPRAFVDNESTFYPPGVVSAIARLTIWNRFARGDQARLLVAVCKLTHPDVLDIPECLED